jgi:hypothetical protein
MIYFLGLCATTIIILIEISKTKDKPRRYLLVCLLAVSIGIWLWLIFVWPTIKANRRASEVSAPGIEDFTPHRER